MTRSVAAGWLRPHVDHVFGVGRCCGRGSGSGRALVGAEHVDDGPPWWPSAAQSVRARTSWASAGQATWGC